MKIIGEKTDSSMKFTHITGDLIKKALEHFQTVRTLKDYANPYLLMMTTGQQLTSQNFM